MSIQFARNEDGTCVSECDVCKVATISGTHDDSTDRALLEAAGWRWNASRDPLDSCPDCLKKGR